MAARDRRPVERERQRGNEHAENGSDAQALGKDDGAVARPESPGPETEHEEVIPLPGLTSRVRGENPPAERGARAHVEVECHAAASAHEEKEQGAPPAR